ncbi:MAG TPA: DNA polymerase III subunit gamma/tau [Thermoleophilia bacterium]|nr:DNA polymerase III subunit gamma/tau [Thermoleophilia bacterium]
MELSLYRKYRPQTFAEIAGQDHVSTTLQNAVRSGTVAHAYVFAGSRGTGKTSTAKILAKALNCTGPDAEHPVTAPTVTPCGVCDSCRSIAASTALDVIEMDAASNRGIDDIRELRDKVAYAPVQGRYKVYIVDEAHMLTKEAFNALLKTLEEPPAHVVFVLATTEVHRIPATILSRCQRFDFRRPRVHDIALVVGHIADDEHITIDEPAVLEIARHAEGGFRDAIGTLEKLTTYFGDAPITSREVLDVLGVIATELLFEIVDIVIERDPAAALLFVQRLAEHGTSYPQFIHDLLRHLRQVFLVQYFSDVSDDRATLAALSQNLEIDEQLLDRLSRQASQLPGRELLRLIELLGGAQTEIRGGLDPRLQLEMALVKAARPEVDHSPDALEERLRRLESGSVPFAPSSTPKPAAGGAAAARVAAATTPKPAAPRARPPEPAAAAPDVEAEATSAEATTAVAAEAPDAEPEAAEAPPGAEAPEATPAEAEPDGGAARVKRAWQLVLQQAEAQNVTLYAAIKDARVHADGETLVVSLPSSLTFGRASSPANRELLGAIIVRTTGDTPELQYELAGDQAAPSSAPRAAEPDAGLTIAERIALAKRELDASELPDDD